MSVSNCVWLDDWTEKIAENGGFSYIHGGIFHVTMTIGYLCLFINFQYLDSLVLTLVRPRVTILFVLHCACCREIHLSHSPVNT